jgi:hypothetical protein
LRVKIRCGPPKYHSPSNQAYGMFLWVQHQYDDDATDGLAVLHHVDKFHDSALQFMTNSNGTSMGNSQRWMCESRNLGHIAVIVRIIQFNSVQHGRTLNN